jgi:hypothetical protein
VVEIAGKVRELDILLGNMTYLRKGVIWCFFMEKVLLVSFEHVLSTK